MNANELIQKLNADTKEERLAALRELMALYKSGDLPAPEKTGFVNNHIHTTYSFSPYSPTKALYTAWKNGLRTAGIMDHDSSAGAREFIEAGRIIGMPVTCGVELRVRGFGSPLDGYRINNPDQNGVAYVALHGIPHRNIEKVGEWMAPYRRARDERNEKMCMRLSEIFAPYGVKLDYKADVLPESNHTEGGSVTERHILFALAKKLIAKYPSPSGLLELLKQKLGIAVSQKAEGLILAGENDPYLYPYDLLGVLKSSLVEKFYINATDECPDVREYIAKAKEFGAISAYAYLGDVGDSVTGDKKAQKFEDSYLPLLFDTLKKLGFNAVTYMPSRNTRAQLDRVMEMCRSNALFEISGEDINSPRQSFVCKAMADPAFAHLTDSTYALIGHEIAATENENDGMFTEKTRREYPDLASRISLFAAIAEGR